MNKIQELKKEIERLEKEEKLEENRKHIPYAELAKIGYSLQVPQEARLQYVELFTDFALNKINQIEERKNLKRKKFIIKIGWE